MTKSAGLGESQGIRDRGPAPVENFKPLHGDPRGGSEKQRGVDKTPIEQALDSIQDAKMPKNKKNKESHLPR